MLTKQLLKNRILATLVTLGLTGCIVNPASSGFKSISENGFGAIVYEQKPAKNPTLLRLEVATFQDIDGGKIPIFENPYKDHRLDKWTSVYHDEKHYRVILLEPGTYVIRSFTQQEKWGLCFQEETLFFEVQPKTMSYLGSIDFTDLVLGLHKAINKDPDPQLTKARDQIASYYFEDVPDWEFDDKDTASLERVEAHFSLQSEYSGMQIELAETQAGAFETRKAPLTGRRRCS